MFERQAKNLKALTTFLRQLEDLENYADLDHLIIIICFLANKFGEACC